MSAPARSRQRRPSLDGSLGTGSRGASVFKRVLTGADGSEPGYEACRQAARLRTPDGRLEVLTAVYLAEAALAGWSATQMAADLEAEGSATLSRAQELVGEDASTRLVTRPPLQALLRAAERGDATLVAVGTHGRSRLSEIMIGGVAGGILHQAPCSVLIARPPAAAPFPQAVLVGIDGSPEADAALATAEYLAERFDARLRIVAAERGKGVNLAHVRLRTPFLEVIDERPVDALVAASEKADLVVLGSRGLHGIRALGSVSERVAHDAHCSVLVVRGPD